MTGEIRRCVFTVRMVAVFVLAFTNTRPAGAAGAEAGETNSIKVTEHCEAETFHARCGVGEAVLMTQAKYGRMKVGRCVLRNYGYVGCSANVLPHMDNLCSGRRDCRVRIPDASLDQSNPCPGDFKTYLEAGYHCVKVTGAGCAGCKNGTLIRPQSPVGFLSSEPAPGEGDREEEPGKAAVCEGSRCPWVIQAPAGQRLNITLLDFTDIQGTPSLQATGPQFGGFNTCYRYAIISEPSVEGEIEVCGGQGRERTVYTSISSSVAISPVNGRVRGETPHYLFKYTVFGCPDLEAPPYSWIKREGNSLEIGCRASNQKYHLECNGHEWTGSIGECPPEAAAVGKTKDKKGFKLPTGILISIIVGIALIIGALILTIGLVMIRRRKTADSGRKSGLNIRRVFSREKAGTSGACDTATTTSEYYYSAPYTPSSPKPCYETIINASPSNFYHHTMDSRPLPSVPCQACTTGTTGRGTSGRGTTGRGTSARGARTLPHSHSFTNGTAASTPGSEYTPIDIVSDTQAERSTAYAAIDVVKGTERADRAGYDTINVMMRDRDLDRAEEKSADAGSRASLLSPSDGNHSNWKRHSRKSSSASSTHSYCLPLTRDSGDYSDAPPYYTLDPSASKSSEDSTPDYAVYQRDFMTSSQVSTGGPVQPQTPVEVTEDTDENEADELDTEIPVSETQNEINEIISARNSLERRSASSVENEYQA